MAIGTGDVIEKFGTQAAITNAGVAITNGAISSQSDAIAWTNSDDAMEADLLLEATLAAAASAIGGVDIFARKLNVRGANDENQPVLNDNEDKFLGSFYIAASTTTLVKTARVQLPNGKASQEYEFYFKNATGQNISACQAWITPIASGAHP